MDIYSPNYVPLFFRVINESPAQQWLSPPLAAAIDYQHYISQFAGSSFVTPVQLVDLPPLSKTTTVQELRLDSQYGLFWVEQLCREFTEQSERLDTYALYNVPLSHAPDMGPTMFRLHVPGLQENAPQVELGDVVNVRPFVLPFAGSGELAKTWQEEGRHRGELAPGFHGVEYVAVVWAIDKRKEHIIMYIEGFNSMLACNVSFTLQHAKCEPLYRATLATAGAVEHNVWLRSMLGPKKHDGILQSSLPPAFINLPWIDSALNWEQKKAVDAVVQAQYGVAPYLVFGPPGTGKTKTLVEIAFQLLKKADSGHSGGGYFSNADVSTPPSSTNTGNPHILICAPSDSAADTLALRLATQLSPDQLFRLNSQSRTFAEVPQKLLPYTCTENELFTLPSFEKIMTYQIVVTTCRAADTLVRAKITNEALYSMMHRLNVLVASDAKAIPLHWTALLLDESGQATEPDVLISLQVIMPPHTYDEGRLPQFIAAGDEHQLGPKLASRESSPLHTSFFQRLAERAVYSGHPLSRNNGAPPFSKSMLPMFRPAFTNLIRNYRSHPAILAIPSVLFYKDTIIPEKMSSELVQGWSGWKSPHGWPIQFVQNSGHDDSESLFTGTGTGSGALFNTSEAGIVLQKVQSLLRRRMPYQSASNKITIEGIQQEEIAVIAPFRAQVKHIRKLLRDNNLHSVNVGPLEAFQGLESRIVILCTTRTRIGIHPTPAAKYVLNDKELDLGIIDHPKHFNVAMTRAKEGLILIGNAQCLTVTGDKHWIAFLNFCKRNGCFDDDLKWYKPSSGTNIQVDGQEGDTSVSRLERGLKYAQFQRIREAATKDERTQINTNGLQLRGLQVAIDDMWGMQEVALSTVNDFVWGDTDQEHGDDTTNGTDDDLENLTATATIQDSDSFVTEHDMHWNLSS